MVLHDETLANLYADDQRDRQKLLELKLTNKEAAAIMQQALLVNDAKRRKMVNDLLPESNKAGKDYHDHFYAAAILHRGESLDDQRKAYGHVKKAYGVAKFQQDDFSEQVKKLYKNVCQRLGITPQRNDDSLTPRPQQGIGNRQNSGPQSRASNVTGSVPQVRGANRPGLTPLGPGVKTQKQKEQEVVDRDKKIGLCLGCGRAHRGFCPPKR